MAAYLILYWVSLVLALALYYISKRKKNLRLESLSNFFVVLMMFFLIFALATKGPIEEILSAISVFWQFLVTGIGGAFAFWRVYLNPLKERVISLDRSVVAFETETRAEFKSVRKDMNRVQDGLKDVKSDIQFVKERVFRNVRA